MSTDNLGNENIDMAVGYSNGYKKGYEQGKKDAVKHGHWKDFKYDCQCSVCGMQFDYNDYCTEVFNYCPSCGAKMDGDVNAID